jgi:hypothetical protein
MSRAAWALIVVACLVGSGSAEAASRSHLSGDVSFLGDVLVKGAASVSSQQGIMNLMPQQSTPRATITWMRADVIAYHNTWNFQDTPLPQPAERVRLHADGRIENSDRKSVV